MAESAPHRLEDCMGPMHHVNLRPACCIHNPSPHHMTAWNLARHPSTGAVTRVCPDHGVHHPDPDHLAYTRWVHGDQRADAHKVHECCGDCRTPSTKELEHAH